MEKTYFFQNDELKIPAPRNKESKWITTNAEKSKNELLERHKQENELIIPLIKVIKYFNTLQGKPYDSYIIERFAISRSYQAQNLRDYFLKFINDLNPNEQTEEQKKFILELKSRKENLLALEKRNLSDYIELEMQKFIPLIN